MGKLFAFIAGAGLGASLAAWLKADAAPSPDRPPQNGRVSHVAVAVARTQSLLREIRVLVLHADIPDPVLEKKIRSKIRRMASDPGSISIRVESGKVVLEGLAGRKEVRTLIDGVSSLRGVKEVENHLGPHPEEEEESDSIMPIPNAFLDKFKEGARKLLRYSIPAALFLAAGGLFLAYLGLRRNRSDSERAWLGLFAGSRGRTYFPWG